MVLAKEVSPHFIALKGQPGFSEFRLKAFLEKINVIFPQIESLTCSEVYFLSLNEQIELLEQDRRDAETRLQNWRFEQLETQLAVSEDARSEWENQARDREEQRRPALQRQDFFFGFHETYLG